MILRCSEVTNDFALSVTDDGLGKEMGEGSVLTADNRNNVFIVPNVFKLIRCFILFLRPTCSTVGHFF